MLRSGFGDAVGGYPEAGALAAAAVPYGSYRAFPKEALATDTSNLIINGFLKRPKTRLNQASIPLCLWQRRFCEARFRPSQAGEQWIWFD
jgi:hypothetical protein